MDKFNEKIQSDLDGKKEFTTNRAYNLLLPFTGTDTSRDYLNGVYFENGIACATNAHMLAIVNTASDLDKVLVDSAPNSHKTDIRRVQDDGTVEVICDHKTNKSGMYEPKDVEFPEIAQVYPDNSIDNRGNSYHFDVNGEYLIKLTEALAQDNKRNRLSIAPYISQNGINGNNPIKVEGNAGIGIIMPLRIDN